MRDIYTGLTYRPGRSTCVLNPSDVEGNSQWIGESAAHLSILREYYRVNYSNKYYGPLNISTWIRSWASGRGVTALCSRLCIARSLTNHLSTNILNRSKAYTIP